MALEINKVHNQEAVTPTPQQDAGTTSVKSNNTPINFKSSKKPLQQSEIIDFLNSDKIKKLPKEKQLELLKSKFPFLKDLSDTQINTYISTAQKSAENNSSKTETTQTQNKNELETLVSEYNKKNNLEGGIEKILAVIADKQKADEKLSPEEKKILQLYLQPKLNKLSDKLIISTDKLLSSEFQQLKPEEKLKLITKSYLEKNDKNYQELSDQDKENYLAEKMKDISSMVIDSDHKDKTANIKTLVLVQVAHSKGLSIDELKALSEEERNSMITKAENAVIRRVINLVDKEKINNASYAEKVNVYADTILTVADPAYTKITDPKAKIAYRDKKIDEFIINNFDIKEEEWKKITPTQKQKILQRAAITFSKVIQSTDENGSIIDNLKNIKTLSPLERNTSDLEFLQKQEQTEETKILISKITNENIVLERLESKGIRKPSSQDFVNEIINMEKEGIPVSPYLKQRKTELQRAKDINLKMEIQDRNLADSAVLKGIGKTTAQLISSTLKNCNKNNVKENESTIIALIEATNGDINEVENIRTFLIEKIHIPVAQVDEILDNPEITGKMLCKARNSEEYNNALRRAAKGCAKGVDYAKEANYHVSKWFDDKNEIANIAICTAGLKAANIAKKTAANILNESLTQGMHDNLSRQDNTEIFKLVSDSDQVSSASMAVFTETFIKTAHNDNDRIFYSKNFSSINNAAVTEGLAAASKYVSDPSAKQQYNHYVEVAAKNYPPETQELIKTALKTGEISQETLSKTTPAVSNETSKSETSGKSETQTTNNNTPTQQTTQENKTLGAKTPATELPETKTTQTTTKTYPASSPQGGYTSAAQNYSKTQTSYQAAKENSTTSSKNSNPTYSNTKISESSSETTTQALEQKRDAVAEKIQDFQQHVAESTIERALGKELTAEEAQIIEDYISVDIDNTSPQAISENIQNKIKEIFTKNSITKIYNLIITKFGSRAQDKFIDTLSSYGSSDAIRSFADNMKSDSSIIKKLYLKCSNQKIKTELLSYLPTDELYTMISNGQIANLNDINHKVLYDFLSKNLYSMSNSTFAGYLQYLSLDEREQLVDLRNKSKGIQQPKTPQAETPSTTINYAQNAPITDQISSTATAQTTQNTFTQNGIPSQTPAIPQTKAQDKTQETDLQPKIADNEVTKTLADGTIIKRKETFGAISNNTYEEYEEVKQDPIGMKDEILTPGSEEWKRKYNKQQTPPTTAFTMAAMTENSDEPGMPFGSTKVGMGQKIKKKYPPQSFRFNA